MIDLRFPIGTFQVPTHYSLNTVHDWIKDIDSFPMSLKTQTTDLTDAQLNTPYRSDGWTIRQVIHHCADSHMNSYIRFKLALTESKPTIKPYFEDRWAELPDYTLPIHPSLKLLEGLHQRWVVLLKSMEESDLLKTFIHPEHSKEIALQEYIAFYAWHCNHHLAHITTLKNSKMW